MNNTQIQQRLIDIGLLDGVADGRWGSLTASAYRAARRALTGVDSDTIDETFTNILGQYRSSATLDFRPRDSNDKENVLAARLIQRMAKLGMQINVSMGSSSPTFNIVYASGTNPDGSRNSDRIDSWNDLRFLIQVAQDGTVLVPLCKLATIDAGRYWRDNPMNRLGTAQIDKDKQFIGGWSIGRHGSRQYPALVQVGEISITRDLNNRGNRDSADRAYRGSDYGMNQHHGYSAANVGQMSAGCLVGQSISGHERFMELLRLDRRYRANNGYAWSTAIIDGNTL